MFCSNCKRNNPEGYVFCKFCGNKLEVNDKEIDQQFDELLSHIDKEYNLGVDVEQVTTPPPDVTPLRVGAIEELVSVINKLLKEEIEVEEAKEFIEAFQEELDNIVVKIEELVILPEIEDVVSQPHQVLQKALAFYDEVLMLIRSYFLQPDKSLLEEALKKEEEANKYLSYAFSLIRNKMGEYLNF